MEQRRKVMKRKILATIFGIAIVFCFAGFASAGSGMDRILKNNELVVGITGTQPPLNATTKEGKIIGLDADIANAISANLGVELKFSKMPFDQLLSALQNGKVDMIISGMTMTLERNTKVAFVGPYYISGKGVLTKTSQIASLQDPQGINKPDFRISALKDSTSQMFVTKVAPEAKLVAVQSYDEAIEMLLNDKIDVIVADYPFCGFAAFRYQDKGLIAGQSKLTYEPLGIAVSEDVLLINWLQNFMMAMEGSGKLKLLYKRWFEDGSWIKELP
jgi:polar amino acid transport system substrate-binding protein